MSSFRLNYLAKYLIYKFWYIKFLQKVSSHSKLVSLFMKLHVKDCRVCIGKTVNPKIPSENGISKEKYLNSIRRVFKMLCQAWRLIDHRAWKFDLVRAISSQNVFENQSKWSSTCNWNDQAYQRIKGLFHV